MPTYEYACKSCGEHLEVVQSFKDDALTTCPACGGTLRKVFGSIGIAFKGSGFYRTDSRGGATKKEKDADKDTAKPAAATGDTGTGEKGDKDKTTPAASSTPSESAKPAASSSGSSGSDSKVKAGPKASATAG
jgi:putative FmdB family regulatory protein